jgi:hypothetical protein
MIETEPTPVPAKPTAETVAAAALHRTLRLLARVANRQGTTYDGPSLLIARELFGPSLVNARTWTDVYGGFNWNGSFHSLEYYSGRGYVARVPESTLRAEYQGRVDVSRETAPVPATLEALIEDVPVPSQRQCGCTGCTDEECPGPEEPGGCEACDSHSCEACYGEGYRCDDHGCDTCRPDCYTQSCCGYCSECGTHPDGVDDSDTCSNCGYCHECGHVCDDAG